MKGIIFTSESVKGIIDGRKTQTRRMVTPQPLEESRWMGWLLDSTGKEDSNRIGHACWKCDSIGRDLYVKPRYEVGETVYVKETFRFKRGPYVPGWEFKDGGTLALEFDNINKLPDDYGDTKWRSPLFMPECAARIHIEITGVKAQLVQDITEEDAKAEGITYEMAFECNDWHPSQYDPDSGGEPNYVRAYAALWDLINGKKHPWALPQWVFAYTFKKVEEKS